MRQSNSGCGVSAANLPSFTPRQGDAAHPTAGHLVDHCRSLLADTGTRDDCVGNGCSRLYSVWWLHWTNTGAGSDAPDGIRIPVRRGCGFSGGLGIDAETSLGADTYYSSWNTRPVPSSTCYRSRHLHPLGASACRRGARVYADYANGVIPGEQA